jgi:meso-butanediol dehydrogenase/(S,S)-butanediol dehydrogenase/diacetyl reductase
MGRGIATKLAEEGAQVVVADLNGKKAATVAEEIKGNGGEAIDVNVDVSDRAQVKIMIGKCVEAYGKLDVIFNNAGFNQPMKFMETTEENLLNIFKVNTMGCLIGVQEAAKQMIKQGHGGKII